MTRTFPPRTRLRRLRENRVLAESIREVSLEPRQMILPLFVVPGSGKRTPISGLHGVDHWSVDRLCESVDEALTAGVQSFMLFGLPTEKDANGSTAWRDDQPVQQAMGFLNDRDVPQAYILNLDAFGDIVLLQHDEQQAHQKSLLFVVPDLAQLDHDRPSHDVTQSGSNMRVQHQALGADAKTVDPGVERRADIGSEANVKTQAVDHPIDAVVQVGQGRKGSRGSAVSAPAEIALQFPAFCLISLVQCGFEHIGHGCIQHKRGSEQGQ